MSAFLLVAAAHFLSVLSPGPDLLLITRIAAGAGWRIAVGACLGIALANAALIALVFSGMAHLRPDSPLMQLLQAAGGAYLLRLAWLLLRPAKRAAARSPTAVQPTWAQAWRMGCLSAMLNPKNAMFYGSLATVLAAQPPSVLWRWACGIWMVSIVLAWDVLVAKCVAHATAQGRYQRAAIYIEIVCGVLLGLLGALMLWQCLGRILPG